MIRSFKVGLELGSWMKFFQEMRCVEGQNVAELEQLLHPGPEGRPLLSNKGISHTQFPNIFGIAFQLIP